MFNFANPPLDMEQTIKEREAKSAAMDIIAEMLLKSDTLPEANKIEIRIATTAKRLADKVMYRFCEFAAPLKSLEEAESVFEKRREVLEYLQLVETGVDGFLAINPLPDVLKEAKKDLPL